MRNTVAAGAVATTIGAPVIAEAAAPETAVERAERLWHAFSDAMDEVAEGTDGWVILGAGNRFAHPWAKGGKFLNMRLTTYTNDAETEARIGKPFYIERYKDLNFGESRHDTY